MIVLQKTWRVSSAALPTCERQALLRVYHARENRRCVCFGPQRGKLVVINLFYDEGQPQATRQVRRALVIDVVAEEGDFAVVPRGRSHF